MGARAVQLHDDVYFWRAQLLGESLVSVGQYPGGGRAGCRDVGVVRRVRPCRPRIQVGRYSKRLGLV